MDEYLKEALELVKVQAGVREMSVEEITVMIRELADGLRRIASEDAAAEPAGDVDPQKAIREKSILCLESGKSFKILTRRHLAQYGLTPETYREKWGYPRHQPLVCKALQRERRRRMQEMQLWKRRAEKD